MDAILPVITTMFSTFNNEPPSTKSQFEFEFRVHSWRSMLYDSTTYSKPLFEQEYMDIGLE